ncbi:MAG TPA: aminotransferase class V-fold PLP-dependent enzyme [Actinomycetota bacterium]|jgi:glutamate/tyrosine decarboxylase-like PLP-dependent enzyme
MTVDQLLAQASARAVEYLDSLPERPVGATASADQLHQALGGPLPQGPGDPSEVLAQLAKGAEPGLVASAGPRFFGFVFGGSLPVALAADWLASAWDQNAFSFVASPAGAVVEDVAAGWLRELFGLPPTASAGFVTGCTMANFTCLAAARHEVLARTGWDVERDGLQGAPPVNLVVGEERHVTVDAALRYLGLGAGRALVVPADDQGRMRPDALLRQLDRCQGPTVVCAQAGNVNTGAVDPLGPICAAAHARDAWVHVDGAFGLWAAASPALRPLLDGVELADSWATDAHKWLNVPYDAGLAFVAQPSAHQAATGKFARYLPAGQAGERDNANLVPEASRRARGFPTWAALRTLGAAGVAELVERCCAHARRFAEQLAAAPGVEVLNEVVLNQVLVRFLDPGGDHDARTRAVVGRLQRDGTTWFGGTTWQGRGAMRISVCNWSTSTADVDRSVAAILRAAA